MAIKRHLTVKEARELEKAGYRVTYIRMHSYKKDVYLVEKQEKRGK